MRTKTLTLLLLLVTNVAFGQIPKNVISFEDKEFNSYFQNKDNTPTVKGRVLNVTQEDIEKTKISYSIVTPFEQFQVKKFCTLKPDGSFELELDYPFPYQQIWIHVGEFYYAGIYANTDLEIELDADILRAKSKLYFIGPGIKYLGTDGELNTFLNNYVEFRRKHQVEILQSLSVLNNNREITDDAFIIKYDSLYALLDELNNEFIKQNPSPYSWIIGNESESEYFGGLCVKYWGREMATELFEKVKHHKSYLTSNSGMQFYNYFYTYLSLNFKKVKSTDLGRFRNYSKLEKPNKLILDSILIINQNIAQKQSYDTANYISLIKQATSFLSDTMLISQTIQISKHLDKLFDRSKSDFLKIKIVSKDPNENRLMTETVLDNIQTAWCKEVIQQQYDNSLLKLAAISKVLQESKPLTSENQLGKPIAEMPSGAKLYMVDNINAETLLSNLKKSFGSKALLLDFWATWCAPCLQEMPYSKSLHDNAKDLPVEFIYLCTSQSSNIEMWKSKIAEFKLGGTHIFVEQEIINGLMKLFSVGGFPSYVLINTKGDYMPGAIISMSQLNKDKLSKLIKQ